MHNISTIYRFNTPFLDLNNEKDRLVYLIKKIEKSIEFDWIAFSKKTITEWNYFMLTLLFNDNLWKIEFYYISHVNNGIYHLPIFKLNIFLDDIFLSSNTSRKKAVKFLNNIFECFDWLDEREFLIDTNNSIFYTSWLFNTKNYPSYDFSDIEIIREKFESKNGILLVEDFIKKFSSWTFELTYQKSQYYHSLHSVFLYFIYIVFLMYQNIEKTKNAKQELDNTISEWIFEWHIDLMKKRLSYVEWLHLNAFDQYKNRLELFFKMF